MGERKQSTLLALGGDTSPPTARGERGRSFLPLVHTEKTNDASFINWDCPYQSWKMVNKLTGEVHDFDCKTWTCMVHGPLNAWRWGLRISNVPWTLMLTITNVPEDRAIARRGWQHFARWMRKQGVTTFVKTMELGPLHDMRHYHVLLAGVKYLPISSMNYLLQSHQHGFAWVTPVKSKGRAARYILKYPLKDLGQSRLRFKGWRTVTASRSIPSWKDVQSKFFDQRFIQEEGWSLDGPVNRNV